MINSFNIKELSEVYGWLASYKGLPFPVDVNKVIEYIGSHKNTESEPFMESEKYTGVQSSEYDTGSLKFNDLKGRPVICPVMIGGIKLGTGESKHISMQPLVVIEGSKRIVKTPLAAGSYSGTVKEFINFDDYKIRIHGFLVNENQKQYPVDQVTTLKNLWLRNEALEFQCIITQGLFTHVVIENIIFDEMSMAPGLQRYEIIAISDGIMEVEELVADKKLIKS